MSIRGGRLERGHTPTLRVRGRRWPDVRHVFIHYHLRLPNVDIVHHAFRSALPRRRSVDLVLPKHSGDVCAVRHVVNERLMHGRA